MGLISDTASIGPVAVASLVLLAAALHDMAFRTIPNWMSAVLCVAGLLIRAQSGTLLAGLVAGLSILLCAVFCWWRGWLGGGDVKLLATAALLVPPRLAAHFLIAVALSGGVLALLYLALSRWVTPPSRRPRAPGLLRRIGRAERYRISRCGPLPYASAIAAGAMIVLLKG